MNNDNKTPKVQPSISSLYSMNVGYDNNRSFHSKFQNRPGHQLPFLSPSVEGY